MSGSLGEEPTIERGEDLWHDATIYRLRVPHGWLVAVRWPRLRLSWWFLQMIWQRPYDLGADELQE